MAQPPVRSFVRSFGRSSTADVVGPSTADVARASRWGGDRPSVDAGRDATTVGGGTRARR